MGLWVLLMSLALRGEEETFCHIPCEHEVWFDLRCRVAEAGLRLG